MLGDERELRARISRAWLGRISGCQLGKPVEVLSMREGHGALTEYLTQVDALPVRDYIPYRERKYVLEQCCRGRIARSEPDDDINYSLLALMLLEEHGLALTTADVARAWLKYLPVGATYTAERAAYRILLERGSEGFADGRPPGFDLAQCSDNRYNDWIGAQIRADVYGWVCPGRPALAADLARRDAELSHRSAGVHGAMIVAALGAALAEMGIEGAVDAALAQVPADSLAAEAVRLGRSLAGRADGGARIRERYAELSPVHTLNNLALVIWSLCSHARDFGAAIGDVVAAGLDTDCNGATVGALWGLQGADIPAQWTQPWRGRVAFGLAGVAEIEVGELIDRTVAVAKRIDKAGT